MERSSVVYLSPLLADDSGERRGAAMSDATLSPVVVQTGGMSNYPSSKALADLTQNGGRAGDFYSGRASSILRTR